MTTTFFNPDLAGKPYRPSNGSEGDVFMWHHCRLCRKDNPGANVFCTLIVASMTYDKGEAGYPQEWTHDANGQPTCTAFEAEVDA